MRKHSYLFCLILVHCLVACAGVTPDEQPSSPVSFADAQMVLALGGVHPGWDQLAIDDVEASDQVELMIDPTEIASANEISADATNRTYQIIPHQMGIATVKYSVNGVSQNKVIALIVPPQEMIQILIGEARSIIPQEVQSDEDGSVSKNHGCPNVDNVMS